MKKFEYEEYLKQPEWKVLRRVAIDAADFRCQVCNSSQSLEVHHRTYENVGAETLKDLIVLCKNCHTLFHSEKNERTPEMLATAPTSFSAEQVMQADRPKAQTIEKLRNDIEVVLDFGQDHIGIHGVNRYLISKFMDKKLGIDMKYHTKVCEALDKGVNYDNIELIIDDILAH